MSTLSSCYFCGTALDAPVEAHPVVPEEIPSDDDRTVSLCPTCRRKFHGLLGLAFDAVDGIDSIETTLDESEDITGGIQASDGPATVPADSSDETIDEPTGSSDLEDAADDATDQDSDGESRSAPGGGSPATEPDDDEAEIDGTDESSTESDTDDESGDASANADEDAGNEPTAGVSSSTPATDDGTGGGPREAGSGPSDTASPEPEAAGDDGDGGDEAADGTDDTPSILSTPAAKKVVRLLQNREFPVEREEFAVVAANAYDIPENECADVLDTLVSEGYVGERGGQLVRE